MNKERRTTNPWRGRSRGMTLIELMMVMVIMVIVLSISVPAFNSMGRGSDMRGAVSGVRTTLAQARQWAITHREQVTFCYVVSAPVIQTNYYYVTNAAGLYLQESNSLPFTVRFQNSGSLTFKTDGSLAGGVPPSYIDIVLISSNAGKTNRIWKLTGGIEVK